jgi:hypothetical protein
MSGSFTQEALVTMKRARRHVLRALRLAPLDLLSAWLPTITSSGGQEHLAHGVCRRLKILARAFDNIFRVCPPDRFELLEADERCDVEINLHAFVINVHGLLDNLAWITVFEGCPQALPHRNQVSLFKNPVQVHLSEPATRYLTSERLIQWHADYASAYRDAPDPSICPALLPRPPSAEALRTA